MKITSEPLASNGSDESSEEKDDNVEDEEDSDGSELREMDHGRLENDYDEVSIMLNGNYH